MPLRTEAYPVTVPVRVEINANSTPYTAGDAVGSSFTVAGVARFQIWTGWLASLTISEPQSQQKPALQIHFFDRAISAIANNAPFNLGTSDETNRIFSVPVTASDWNNVGSTGGAQATLKGLGYWYRTLPASCDLVAQVQTDGTPTWTTPNPALILVMQFEPD